MLDPDALRRLSLFVRFYSSSKKEEAGFGMDVGSLHASPPLKVDGTM